MSLGATTSAPASTWLTAVRAMSSIEASFATSPFSITPQCPCEVYSQRHTSVTSTRSGYRSRSERNARWTMPSAAYAPVPSSSLASGIPNRITAERPRPSSSSASRERSSTEKRPSAGSSSFARLSGPTKSG
jgi:hypothetical protein